MYIDEPLRRFRTDFRYHKDLWVVDDLSPLQVGKQDLLFLKNGPEGGYQLDGVHLGKVSPDGADQTEAEMAKAKGDR